ncbi:MAG TPA: N-acetylmuramoyl-L-alanine amidase [Thermoanaerobaculia bacterium]|nr:N-acetylmuramoyl-L-alanine amidase [Thermoanaerobaculia bacterium]
MRKWWVLFLMAAIPAASEPAPLATASINSELRANLLRDYTIDVLVKPHDGDAWSRLAKRVTGDGANWKAIAEANGSSEKLETEKSVRVPLRLLRPELQRQILRTIFPQDRMTDSGWRHVVAGGSGIEGESLWNIAEWFTGDGANYSSIRKANPAQGLSTRPGDVIVVPTQLLAAAFGASSEGQNAQTPANEVRKPEDDPVERTTENDHASALPVEAVAGQSAPSLTYDRSGSEPFAVYRLQKGEALYSSVAIRFTGRVYSKDVGDVLDRLVKFNGIEDVSKIRVGYPVKIPMTLLLPEYLPENDPTRVAREQQKRASAKLAKRTRAKGLSGVRVILDAGHGGRDSGTEHDGVYESTYVYDVMCRLKRIIEKKSGATVLTTTKSSDSGYEVADNDALDDAPNDQAVLTTPRYDLDDPVIGVHLRWYLANSIFHHAIREGLAKEKVVFISLHADSLHPSLRGAMVYIPGERYVQGSFKKSDKVYLARAEVRERPVVTHSEEESLQAEGLSRDLGDSIIDAFESAELKVHPFDPVRDNVVRNGREWVPAVIRYNVVPTRVLVEMCNLGNPRDRALMQTRAYRQKVAQSIYEGIVNFYRDTDRGAQVADRSSR